MSASVIKNVAIAGASGNLGPAILKELLDANKFKVFVTSRHESKSTFPSSVTVLKTDYTVSSLQNVIQEHSIDAVVSNLSGPAAVEPEIALIDAAKAAGVKRFIPGEFGLDSSDAETRALVPLFEGKAKVAAHLKKVQSDAFTWTGIVNGPFFDYGLRIPQFLGVDLRQKKFFKWDDGNVPFTATNLSTIGKAVASILGSSSNLTSTANKHIYISSFNITLNELFSAVEKVSGETWPVDQIDSKAAAAKAKEGWASGNPMAAYGLLSAAIYGNGIADYRKVGLSNEALGLPKEDLVEEVRKIMTA